MDGRNNIDIPIHDLSDDTMLRIMAEENNDPYVISIYVVNETIRQVKKYLTRVYGLKSVNPSPKECLTFTILTKVAHGP